MIRDLAPYGASESCQEVHISHHSLFFHWKERGHTTTNTSLKAGYMEYLGRAIGRSACDEATSLKKRKTVDKITLEH